MKKEMGTSLSQEFALLFKPFIPSKADETESFLDAIQWKQLAWQKLMDIGLQHRLLPLLYSFLSQNNTLHRVPETYQFSIKRAYYASLDRGIRLQNEYQDIANAFDSAGIPHRPLRGIEWIRTVYDNNPALRPMTDIDLFVPPRHKEETRKILFEKGFQLYPPKSHHDHHDMFMKGSVIVDVHNKLFVDGILALFPDFDVGESLEKLDIIKGKPLAALHHWIHRDRPAIRVYDFIRLRKDRYNSVSQELKWILEKTEKTVKRAQAGDYQHIFDGEIRYRLFWTGFIFRSIMHKICRHPLKSIPSIKGIFQWQWKRMN